jgi:transcriptional regulator with XRE-family HTH domain
MLAKPHKPAEIGDILRRWRLSRRWTSAILAEKLGVSEMSISRYERGLRQISRADLARFAAVFGHTVIAFLAGPEREAEADALERGAAALMRLSGDDLTAAVRMLEGLAKNDNTGNNQSG